MVKLQAMYVKKVSLSTKPAKQYSTLRAIVATKFVTRLVYTHGLENNEIEFYHYLKRFTQ